MLRNCYKCYKSVKCRSSAQEIPRQVRYLAPSQVYTRGASWEAGLLIRAYASCELGELPFYARGASWASWIYAREGELENLRWVPPKKD